MDHILSFHRWCNKERSSAINSGWRKFWSLGGIVKSNFSNKQKAKMLLSLLICIIGCLKYRNMERQRGWRGVIWCSLWNDSTGWARTGYLWFWGWKPCETSTFHNFQYPLEEQTTFFLNYLLFIHKIFWDFGKSILLPLSEVVQIKNK